MNGCAIEEAKQITAIAISSACTDIAVTKHAMPFPASICMRVIGANRSRSSVPRARSTTMAVANALMQPASPHTAPCGTVMSKDERGLPVRGGSSVIVIAMGDHADSSLDAESACCAVELSA